MSWSTERTDLCVKLWNEGLSCSVIARRIGGGISRNAVIGKIHRLGLSNTRQVHHPKKMIHARQKSPRGPNRNFRISDLYLVPPKVQPRCYPLPPEPPRPKTLIKFDDLTEIMCRFPYGDPKTKDFGFCGCKSLPGSRYCEGHHARMYTAPRPKSRYNPAGQPPAGIPKQIAKYIPSAEDCVEAIA